MVPSILSQPRLHHPPTTRINGFSLSLLWMVTTAVSDWKKDFAENERLRAWVNVGDPAKSYTHYQVRRIEDQTQKDWFAKIKIKLQDGMKEANGPCIVIQPPKNGEFGPNKTVVAMIFGYDGDTAKLSNAMRAGIVKYVDAMNRRGLVTHNPRIDYSKDGARYSGDMLESEAPSMMLGGAGQMPIPDRRIDPFLVNGPTDIPPPVVVNPAVVPGTPLHPPLRFQRTYRPS
jgi:hypothetical protein